MDNNVTQIRAMLRIAKNKYVIVFAILLILIFFFLMLLSFSSSTPEEKSIQPKPTSSPVNSKIAPTIVYEAAPDSIKFGVGESIGGHIEVEAEKELLSDGSIKYTFESMNPNRQDIFIVKDRQIILRRHAVVGQEISDEYKNMLGKQDHTLAGRTFYGSETVIYFFESLGAALIVNPETQTTYEVFTFRPMPLEDFELKYKKYAL